jgi:hypothetical protein
VAPPTLDPARSVRSRPMEPVRPTPTYDGTQRGP